VVTWPNTQIGIPFQVRGIADLTSENQSEAFVVMASRKNAPSFLSSVADSHCIRSSKRL
jgi:hypothetical protein